MASIFKNGKSYMYCPQCGEEMEEKARYCMHCGYVNYDNEKNAFLHTFVKKDKKNIKFGIHKEKKKKEITSAEFNKEFKKFGKSSREIMYTTFRNIISIVLIIAFIYFVYYGGKYVKAQQTIFVGDAQKIVNAVKKKEYVCKTVYYVSFTSDSLKEKYGLNLHSPYRKNDYSGYVMIVKNDDGDDYFITLTDGTFGIKEKNINNIKNYDVLPVIINEIPVVDSTKC